MKSKRNGIGVISKYPRYMHMSFTRILLSIASLDLDLVVSFFSTQSISNSTVVFGTRVPSVSLIWL